MGMAQSRGNGDASRQTEVNTLIEQDIQNSIRIELSKHGFFTERINVGEGFLVPKDLFETIKRRCPDLPLHKISYFKTGAVKGRSDLSAVKDGRIYYLEVKTPTGRVRPEQEKFLAVMRDRYGCTAGIVRSTDDALELVGVI